MEIIELLDAWLRNPGNYEHGPNSVECVETHISRVFLAGSVVYKLKKPVRYDFLDFSTLAAREQACREEVRLNRRLARHIYLGVVPVTREANGSFALDGTGEIVDWAVKMQRLPADQMLDMLHRGGLLRHEHIRRLTELLSHFYSHAQRAEITTEQYRSRCLAHVHGNFVELLANTHLPRAVVQRVHAFQLQLLHCNPALFDARVRAARIVEGHGDLRPEHICLTDPIAIYDCIEFNLEFRQLDIADELVFLAAECDYIGADWVGPCLLDKYQQLSGDHPPPVLLDFYRAYRASVRAKVASLRAFQVVGTAQETAAQEAAAHLAFADRYSKPHSRPLVLLIGGLSGSGKTTLARELAHALGAELLRSDVIRQTQCSGTNPLSNQDKYRPEIRDLVYQEMFQRAEALHQQDVSVVLDATFSNAASIRRACAIATRSQSLFLAVQCHCRPEIALKRIVERAHLGLDASEANSEVFEQQQQAWEPWPEDIHHCRIDTEQTLDRQIEQVIAKLSSTWIG